MCHIEKIIHKQINMLRPVNNQRHIVDKRTAGHRQLSALFKGNFHDVRADRFSTVNDADVNLS